MSGEGGGISQAGEIAEEAKLAGLEGVLQTLEEQSPEQARQNPHGQEKSRPAGDPSLVPGLSRGRLERQAAARHDAVDMRMMVEILTPSMKHGDHADLGAEFIRQAYRELIGNDRGAGDVMRVDLAAYYDRDPACTRYIEPVLYFKGFHALQT